jgi:hypothetical protein
VRSNGRLTYRRKCRRLLLIRVHGTGKWSINLKRKMPPGSYRMTASGLDKKNNREHQRGGNTINFKVK